MEVGLLPSAPRALPSATFSGGGAAAAELQQRWFSAAAGAWDGGAAAGDNLAAALQIELPPPSRQQLAWLGDLRRPYPFMDASVGPSECGVAGPGGEGGAAEALLLEGGGAAAGGGWGGDVEMGSGSGSSSRDDSDDEANAGACGICYAVLLRDPAASEDHRGERWCGLAAAVGLSWSVNGSMKVLPESRMRVALLSCVAT